MPHLSLAELNRDWAENPRWNGVERPYAAEDVVRLRGTAGIEYTLAHKGEDGADKARDDFGCPFHGSGPRRPPGSAPRLHLHELQ